MLKFLFAINKDFVRAALDLPVSDNPVDEHKRAIFIRFDVRVMS